MRVGINLSLSFYTIRREIKAGVNLSDKHRLVELLERSHCFHFILVRRDDETSCQGQHSTTVTQPPPHRTAAPRAAERS